MKIDENLEYAAIQVKLLNYNTILTSAPINRLFLPIPDYTNCSNNRPDYAYDRLICTALLYTSQIETGAVLTPLANVCCTESNATVHKYSGRVFEEDDPH